MNNISIIILIMTKQAHKLKQVAINCNKKNTNVTHMMTSGDLCLEAGALGQQRLRQDGCAPEVSECTNRQVWAELKHWHTSQV